MDFGTLVGTLCRDFGYMTVQSHLIDTGISHINVVVFCTKTASSHMIFTRISHIQRCYILHCDYL
jgi:hypothetical protein